MDYNIVSRSNLETHLAFFYYSIFKIDEEMIKIELIDAVTG